MRGAILILMVLAGSPLWGQYYGQFKYKPAGGGTPVEVCAFVTDANSDAEEGLPGPGSVNAGSSDLEISYDNSQLQAFAVRFTGMNIPAGATITEANIQFTVDNTSINDPCSVDIYGVEGTNKGDFSAESNGEITNLDWTEASLTWTLTGGSWSPAGNKGPDQLTPNFSSVVQEIVDHPSYQSTWAIVIVFDGVEGERECESTDSQSDAVELCITYLQ